MSNEIKKCVQEVVSNLENELARIETLQPGETYESENDDSLEGVLRNKERHCRTAVDRICRSSSCVDEYSEEHASNIMINTLEDEIKDLNMLLSFNEGVCHKSRLKEIALLNGEELNTSDDENDIASLKRVQAQAKEDLDTVLNTLYPDLKDDIKEILSLLEGATKNAKTEQDRLLFIDEPQLCPALELLEATFIIKKVKQQFESAFKPGRLSDWSAGWKIPVRPQARRLPTKVIADDRGHLLPGIPRHGNPWPPFKHAYQYPRRITRRFADDVNWPPEERKRLTSWEKRSRHIPILPGEEVENKLENPSVKYSLQERRKENRRRKKKNETPNKSEVGSPLKINEYNPYSKDGQDFSHTLGYDKLTKVVDEPQRVHQDLEEYKNNCREVVKEPLQELLEKSQEMAGSKGSSRVSSPAQKKERMEKTPSPAASSPPLEVDFISAIHAKTMAQENLKHQPLPDTVDDVKIKSLQMKELKELKESDRATTAVGWKSFNSPGPTQCAKIRVYRPKTGAIKKKSLLDKDLRPKTSVMFNKDVNEIDLALCWDLLPPRPEDEPRRPKHIDGSNGSAAPSVFTVVKPLTEDIILDEGKSSDKKPRPKTAWEEKKRLPEPTNPSAVMDIINNNAELIDTKRKPSHTPPLGLKKLPSPPASQGSGVRSPDKFSQGSKSPDNTKENSNPNIQNSERKHSSSSGRVGSGQNRSLDTSIDSDKLSRHKHYRSSPNLPAITDKNHSHNHKHNKMMFSRPCMACEVKGSTSGSDGSRRPKSEYKMAFKAGQPGNFNGRPVTAKVAVPKPKTPFAKRSYSIGTLIPPFSLWQGTAGMEYPEHWRLASVYQHSYKPVETRKKPLIQSVYQ